MKKIFIFFMCSFSLLASEPKQETTDRRLAISTEPWQILIGSYNLSFEFKASKLLSVYLPVYFAQYDAALIRGHLFWKTTVGFGVGAKIHFTGETLNNGFYFAPEIGMMVAYTYFDGNTAVFADNEVYRTYNTYAKEHKTYGPFWVPTTALLLGYNWVDSNSGFMLDAAVGVRSYGGLFLPDLKLAVGYAF